MSMLDKKSIVQRSKIGFVRLELICLGGMVF